MFHLFASSWMAMIENQGAPFTTGFSQRYRGFQSGENPGLKTLSAGINAVIIL
jgi:hypothetical protein